MRSVNRSIDIEDGRFRTLGNVLSLRVGTRLITSIIRFPLVLIGLTSSSLKPRG